MKSNFFIIANWKIYLSPQEEVSLFKKISALPLPLNTRFVICPSMVTVQTICEMQRSKKIPNLSVGAQDCDHNARGAFTGDISPNALASVGCRSVLVGHSERRRFGGETNQRITDKLLMLLRTYPLLTPIICVGETTGAKYRASLTHELQTQLNACLRPFKMFPTRRLMLAYEPVWAIGSGTALSHEHFRHVKENICAYLSDHFTPSFVQQQISVLYGGSVKAKDIPAYRTLGNADGLLIGSASTSIHEWKKIIHACI